MNSTFTYSSYLPNLTSIQDVLSHMQQINTEIQNTDISNLYYFNQTYTIITQNVSQKLHTHYFNNDQNMEQFDIHFAQYYFDALKNFTQKTKIAPAWQKLFTLCQKNNSSPELYMAYGVNAHVNNDLPQTLYTIETEQDKQDYKKINEIIKDSLKEVLSTIYSSQSHSLSFPHSQEYKLRRESIHIVLSLVTKIFSTLLTNSIIYQVATKPLLSYTIKNWRNKAWKTSIQIKNGQWTKNEIEKSATSFWVNLLKTYLK